MLHKKVIHVIPYVGIRLAYSILHEEVFVDVSGVGEMIRGHNQ